MSRQKYTDKPPPGMDYVEQEYWEHVRKPTTKKPVNGHLGVYAYHNDDCRCIMGGHYCNRDGYVWSCCGATERYCHCRR